MEKDTKKAIKISLIVLAIVTAYATVRYNILKGVAWEHFPLYISNKAISLAAVVLIGLSYLFGSLERLFPGRFAQTLGMRKFLGLAGFGLGAVHGVISLLIFTPAYYNKFFDVSGKLNLIGELSMLFGVLAILIFSMVAVSSLPGFFERLGEEKWKRVQRLGYGGLVLVGGHVLVMGFGGWLTPAGWPGGLLPISLVAFIVIAITLLLRLFLVLKNK